MLHIHCSGSPREMGRQHGLAAKAGIERSLAFYSAYFWSKSRLDWPAAVSAAARFEASLQARCPHLVEEMRGIAEGAGLAFGDVLALNVRTEIAMGLCLPSDGCTALYWGGGGGAGGGGSYLAQNWDWETLQRQNLVVLHVRPPADSGRPAAVTITEAGIVAKIGFNEHGVGVCLNAILARGVDYGRLPVHVALRTALEHRSRADAVAALQAAGVAASCHILVADAAGAVGLECSYADVVALQPTGDGVYAHTNHWLAAHAGPEGPLTDATLLPSSVPRLTRADALLGELKLTKITAVMPDQGISALEHILEDELNFPGSINAASSADSAVETLFGIVMDLANKTARVRIGRPTEAVESFTLKAE